MLSDRPVSVRVGDFFPFRRVGFTGLLVVFTAGSAEDQTEIKAEPEVTKEKAMAKTKPVAASPVAASPAEDIGQTIGCWPFWRRSDYADIMCCLRITREGWREQRGIIRESA